MPMTSTEVQQGSLAAVAEALSVLHVEDDATIARGVARALRRAGYEVVSVVTAEAAIAEIGARRFDVVVSDYNLAGEGNGADVLIAATLASIPFIFLCSDERADVYDGVTRLDKPASASAIRAAIEAALEQPKVVREMPLDGAFDGGAA